MAEFTISTNNESSENLYTYEVIERIADFLKTRIKVKPKIGIFCGTGLGAVTDLVTNPIAIPYEEIPNFPVSTVSGHAGRLVFGHIGVTPVMCMQGRFHFFEGYPLWKCVMPVRLMNFLGVTTLILSNAAGGINPSYSKGDIMLMNDHINFLALGGFNPLRGFNEERFGTRFVSINDAYDRQLLEIAGNAAEEVGLEGVQQGVYACLGGPSFETIAEVKMLRVLGADAVGMSTVHEVIAARHCGMKCFAFSLITNQCVMDYDSLDKADHVEILDVGKQREKDVKRFVERLLQRFAEADSF